MGKTIQLTAADDHPFSAYVAEPAAEPRGAIVVVQEIFGVNSHIRSVADGYASEGYLAIAPALFDRRERDLELGYDEAGIARGRELAFPLGWDDPAKDIQAAAESVAHAGKVGIVGYCWGGSLAFLASAKCSVDAAVGYYGGQILKILDAMPELQPQVPLMLHFGEQDTGIPLADVDNIQARFPELPVHLYDAGHGFNCDQRGSYSDAAAGLALQRTLDFFAANF